MPGTEIVVKPAPQRKKKPRKPAKRKSQVGASARVIRQIGDGGGRTFSPIAKMGLPKGKLNRYLMTLIDPERHHGVRYPDSYCRATGILRLIQNVPIPYIPADVASIVDQAGSYYVAYRPSLVHPIWFYGVYGNSDNAVFECSIQNERFGLRSLANGDPSVAEQDGMRFLPKGTQMNVACAQVYRDQDFVGDPFKRILSDGTVLFGHTYACGAADASHKFNFQLRLNGKISAGDIITFTATNGTNTLNTPVTLVNDQYEVAVDSANNDFLLRASGRTSLGQCAGRALPVGFRIQYDSANAGNKGIEIISLIVKQQSSVAFTEQLGMYPFEWPDETDALKNFTRYRPVSASAWCAYEGSTLDNGGAHACIMYQGGDHPNQAGLSSYDAIARVPGSYEDKLRVGSYQYWLPASTADTQMRPPVNTEEWRHPYMAICGFVGDTTQQKPLRLRAVMNVEFVSDSQLFDYQSQRPQLWQIAQVQKVLFNAPTSMSNDGHWKQIWNWMKTASEDTARWFKENEHWLVPVAKGLGSAAMMLL